MSLRSNLSEDRSGIGGFIEAVLAIIVVISAVTLVSISISMVNANVQKDSDERGLDIAAEEMMGGFLSLGWPYFEGNVLQGTSLTLLGSSEIDLPDGVAGGCVMLQDLSAGSDAFTILGQGPVPNDANVLRMSEPVLLRTPDGSFHAAKVTVVVW